MADIIGYGERADESMRAEGMDAFLRGGHTEMERFMYENGDMFAILGMDSDRAAAVLKGGISEGDLIERYCGAIPVQVIRFLEDAMPSGKPW